MDTHAPAKFLISLQPLHREDYILLWKVLHNFSQILRSCIEKRTTDMFVENHRVCVIQTLQFLFNILEKEYMHS